MATGTKQKYERDVKRILAVVVASVIISLNIKVFVKAGGVFPGGFTGLAVLVQRSLAKFCFISVPYAPISLALNAIPAIICFKTVGRKFTELSVLCIVLTSFLTDLIPIIPVTYDKLLTSIFGGIVMGIGISICIMAEATSGGTDFIAMFFSQKYGIDTFSYIFAGNMVMLCVAGLLFGWDAALYSIIFQFCSTQVVQSYNKRYQKNTMLIISDHPGEVEKMIHKFTHHGATRIDARGSYTKKERPIVYSVVSSDRVKPLIAEIHNIDENAFVNVIKTDQIEGNFYIKPLD